MAEGRMLKKKISVDGRWADLANDTHRLLFTIGIAHLDIEGRISGDPREFKAAGAPMLDHITKDMVLDFFNDAGRLGLIQRYQADGRYVVQYPGFKKNQNLRVDKEAKSVYPPPPIKPRLGIDNDEFAELLAYCGTTPGIVQEDSGTTPVKGKEGKLNKEKENCIASPHDGNGDARPRFTCSHFEISEEYFTELLQDYKVLTEKTLILEIKKARDWLDDNPNRHKRTAKGYLKNPKSFIRNWLSKVVVDPTWGKQVEEKDEREERHPDPKCSICQGSGWEHFEKGGKKFSRDCNCLRRLNGQE